MMPGGGNAFEFGYGTPWRGGRAGGSPRRAAREAGGKPGRGGAEERT